MNINAFLSTLMTDEDGQGMVEYALILALIAVVVIVTLQAIGTQINSKYEYIKSKLGEITTS